MMYTCTATLSYTYLPTCTYYPYIQPRRLRTYSCYGGFNEMVAHCLNCVPIACATVL